MSGETCRLWITLGVAGAAKERLQARLLSASGAVLSKALFGRNGERQERPRSEHQRSRQPGVAGYGRTLQPALEERTEAHNPPADARECTGCKKPYLANGAEVSTILEIEDSADKRVIRRSRWAEGVTARRCPPKCRRLRRRDSPLGGVILGGRKMILRRFFFIRATQQITIPLSIVVEHKIIP